MCGPRATPAAIGQHALMTAAGDTPEGSASYLQVPLDGPAAGFTADLDSIARDLKFARSCAAAYVANEDHEDSEDHSILLQALWNAGVISYRRATSKGTGHLVTQGKRPRLEKELVPLLSEEQRQVHEQVMDMADKHVAHRVRDYEQARVVAVLEPPPGERRVVGIGVLGVHMIGPTPEVAQHLAEICALFLDVLSAQAAANNDALTKELNASADLDELYRAATTLSGL